MQFSIKMGQNEFLSLHESKVLTYSHERDMFAKQGRDGAQVNP
jgi:hypothetical protein